MKCEARRVVLCFFLAPAVLVSPVMPGNPRGPFLLSAANEPLPVKLVIAPAPSRILFGSCLIASKPHPILEQVVKESPDLAAWDGHDYGLNDTGTEYPAKGDSRRLFLDSGGHTRGYTTSRSSDLPQGFSLSCRTSRYSASTWMFAEYHGWEPWANFPGEKERLFRLISESGAGGVVILSGDRHFAEISRVEGPGLYCPLRYHLERSQRHLPHRYPERRREQGGRLLLDRKFRYG